MSKIYVIGAGVKGHEEFGRRALELIRQADLLVGGERQLALFPEFGGEKLAIGNNLGTVIDRLKSHPGSRVVLASGDPLFFGIGRHLLRNLPDADFEFLPNVSSVQYAFAKIREPWDDTVFVSTHGRGIKEAVDRIVANDKAAVLTDDQHNPAAIARELIERGRDGYTAWLCENLGSAEERIVRTDVRGLLEITAASLNVLILIKEYEAGGEGARAALGIADEEFSTVKKLITKEEVRAVSLAKLRLRHDMTLWDIGAGSGSVSIEADQLLPNGEVYAVERNPQCLAFLKENLGKFQSRHVNVVAGEAPGCFDQLPDPDRVFIGGSGGNLWDILKAIDGRLPAAGRVVLNAVTLDTLTAASEFFENAGYQLEVVMVNIARTRPLTDYKLFEAHNPVFVITAAKE
jgi:precorrin-6Y C5,15-methyltransferase (decarboxylating)